MADKKVSELPSATQLRASDVFSVVTGLQTTPVSKQATVKNVFGHIAANAVFSANVTVTGNKTRLASNVVVTKVTTVNTFVMTVGVAPSTSNAATEGWSAGRVHIGPGYIYVATDSNTIKRAALSSF